MKKIVYIDMDGVIADFDDAISQIDPNLDIKDGPNWEGRSLRVDAIIKEHPSMFRFLKPIEGAIEAVKKLDDKYDIMFLSTPVWSEPESYSGKRIWLEKHFGDLAKHKLILTKRKELNIGDYLIDDTTRNGVLEFKGEHIHFGTEKFPTWKEVLEYLNV